MRVRPTERSHRSIVIWSRRLTVASLAVLMTLASPVLRAQGPPPQAAVDVDGVLEVQIEDSVAGARVHHFLHFGNQTLRLSFGEDRAPELLTGTRVRAHGRLQNNTLDLSSKNGGSLQTQALAGSSTFGQQKVLVLLVNFQDDTSTTTDVASAQSIVFGSTSDFYMENTYGQTSLAGDVQGWFTLPMSGANCDYTTIASLADRAATSAGINIGAYSRHVYAFPRIGNCGWWGLGTVGGSPSQAWINGTFALKVVSHELGHNFGMYHSHSLPCDASGCSSIEYGDDHDDMGQYSQGHFNAFQKERMGWLNYGSSPTIQSVSSTGTYALAPYEVPGSGPKALKILKGSGVYYYVESRAQVGFDGGDAPGVVVHTGSSADGNSSNQVDLDPVGTGFGSVLGVNQTFTDSSIGLSISTVSSDASGASVYVTYSGPPCVSGTPSMSLSPGGTVIAAPGNQVSFSVSIRNNDGSTCAPTTFALGNIIPSGWSASDDSGSLTVSPGSSNATMLRLTPATDANGTSSFTTTASRMNSSGPGTSASGTVLVTSGLAVSVSVSNSRSGYQISASVSAGGSAVSGAPVTFTITDPQGRPSTMAATTNANGIASVKISLKGRDPRGTYQVQATVSASGMGGSGSASFVY